MALTLNGGTYALSRIDIGEAIKASGVPGVAVKWFDIDRLSDTTETVELAFNGDIMEAGAIASYNGPSLSAQLPVTASKEDMLAANFPNPFNPETWIPYQLAADADVTLTIHALDGQLIRRLVLGHQTAGTYYSRSRAAYWDGRNNIGEPVASGVYFYTLAAGDFSATRRMLIRK